MKKARKTGMATGPKPYELRWHPCPYQCSNSHYNQKYHMDSLLTNGSSEVLWKRRQRYMDSIHSLTCQCCCKTIHSRPTCGLLVVSASCATACQSFAPYACQGMYEFPSYWYLPHVLQYADSHWVELVPDVSLSEVLALWYLMQPRKQPS